MELWIGIVLAILLWLISAEPFRRWLRQSMSRLFRRHPAVAVELDIAVFVGSVEILTDELLSHPADATRKKQFYEMAPLDWDIIAADADIERDQQADLIEQLCQPFGSLRFVCIHGEPGSGKSTLAWRVAAELHKRHRALVIRVKDKEAPEVWYRMTEFCYRVGRPVYVLADDLFRNAEVHRALGELNPWLPLTILATSRTNEYRPGRLKGQVVPIALRPPSVGEKERVLRRMGQDFGKLNTEQRRRLNAANEFLVLMLELTSGKGFHEVVEDSLDNLFRLHEPVYRAYEYLCFSYSFEIAMPTVVLERLDPEGKFHDLPNQQAAQGLVFYTNENSSELVRPGHPRRAETAQRLFESRRSSATVLREMVRVLDVSNPLEREFIARLLRSLALERTDVLQEALPSIERTVSECFQQATRVAELTVWRGFYLALGLQDEADRCVDAALASEPVTSGDCNMALHLYREHGRERDALPVLNRWIHNQPEWGGVGPAYLRLVERYCTQSHQESAIDETSAWLAAHPDDNYVRTAYLGLVERKATPEQAERVLQETGAWLAARPHDQHMRTAYLGLVERKATPEQTERVLQETGAWLAAHPDDNYVRTAYLGLVERKATPEQTERVLQETGAWLAAHPDDNSVLTPYLGLVERKATPEQTERVLQETGAWLAAHPDDNYVRTAYLGLVERKATPAQTERVLQETCAWLAAHPDDNSVLTPYLGLVERRGTPEQTGRVLQETAAWVRAHPTATDVWVRFISYLCRFEKFDDARALVEEAVRIHSANSNLVRHYLSLTRDRLDETATRHLYLSLIRMCPRDSLLKIEWARWLRTHNYQDEAEDVFKTLIAEHPKSSKHLYPYGRLLLDMQRYGEAADQFRRVLAIHHGHHAMAHDGLAQAVRGLTRRAEEAADHSEAARLAVSAEREFKSAIRWAGVANDRSAIIFTHLGWFYVDRKRWRDALGAFDQAANKNPEHFGNYWGQGRAFVGLERWRDAARALRTALEKAPDPLGPPASDDIRELIELCEAALTNSPDESQVDAV
jgi:tetratricopeptide (TPR) repeat protein